MVKMIDVAERAGVSVATVSNVLTGKRVVSPEITARVMKAIDELDYHVNMMARGLKTQKSNLIGVVLPDITKLFFNDVLKGIITAANDAGYNISVLTTNFNTETERRQIAALKANNCEAIILDTCSDCVDADKWSDEITNNGNSTIPIVCLEVPLNPDKVSSVLVDCHSAGYQMTSHLLEMGKKKILYISGPQHLQPEKERLAGYMEALTDYGVRIDQSLIVQRDFMANSSYDAVLNVLKSEICFDAIQGSNDEAAIGALKALIEMGIKVPEELVICGFDNLFPSSIITPSITTIDVPRFDMGYAAVKECLRRIDNPDAAPRSIELKTKFITRQSTVADAKAEWDLTNW